MSSIEEKVKSDSRTYQVDDDGDLECGGVGVRGRGVQGAGGGVRGVAEAVVVVGRLRPPAPAVTLAARVN